jgi:hypothetical protein
MGCGGSKGTTETVVEQPRGPASSIDEAQKKADDAAMQALKEEAEQLNIERVSEAARIKAEAEEKAFAAAAAKDAEIKAAEEAAAKKKKEEEEAAIKASQEQEKVAPPPIPAPSGDIEAESKSLRISDVGQTEEHSDADNYASLQPNIGFVVKTKRQTDKSKIFINIFYHERLASMISTAAKTSLDKSGNECLAYDVIIPYNSFVDCAEDEIVRNKLCLEAIELVNSLYFDSLSEDYIVPKMKRGYVGDSIELVDVPLNLIIGEKKGEVDE